MFVILNERQTARIQTGYREDVWRREDASGPALMFVTSQEQAVSVSLRAVDEFAAAMEAFTPTEATLGEEVSPSGDIWYDASPYDGECPMCGEGVSCGDPAVVFEQWLEEVESPLGFVVVHPWCTSEVAQVARRVWDHTGELVADAV